MSTPALGRLVSRTRYCAGAPPSVATSWSPAGGSISSPATSLSDTSTVTGASNDAPYAGSVLDTCCVTTPWWTAASTSGSSIAVTVTACGAAQSVAVSVTLAGDTDTWP